MKRYLVIIMVLFFAASCSSPQKAIRKGNYDKAIRHSVKKLSKDPSNDKAIQNLEKAYRLANQTGMQQIEMLRMSGQSDVWDEIFNMYNRMRGRQEMVSRLDQSVQYAIGFKPVDYAREIIEAQKKAAEFFYGHAMMLLGQDDRFSAREAYRDLMKVKSYYNFYKDTDQMLLKALEKGTTHVLFEMKNQSGIPLPPAFEEELTKISLSDLNRQWCNYDTRSLKGKRYDYIILLNIKHIVVSPEKVSESRYSQSKEVDDGWQYVLDKNGNVMKDSLGNDIKIPKKKTITCHIIETQLHKMATVEGTLDYIDNYTGQLIKTDPIAASTVFEYYFAIANGDFNALKPETRRLLDYPQIPFPPDPELILQASGTLKEVTKNIINRNRNVIK